mgnify:CR=1 FL=1
MSVQLILNQLKDVNANFALMKKEIEELKASLEGHKKYVEKNLKIEPVDIDRLIDEVKRSIPKNESIAVLNKINKSLERVVSDTRRTSEKSQDIYKLSMSLGSSIKDIKGKIDGAS